MTGAGSRGRFLTISILACPLRVPATVPDAGRAAAPAEAAAHRPGGPAFPPRGVVDIILAGVACKVHPLARSLGHDPYEEASFAPHFTPRHGRRGGTSAA